MESGSRAEQDLVLPQFQSLVILPFSEVFSYEKPELRLNLQRKKVNHTPIPHIAYDYDVCAFVDSAL